ncbi:MAG: DUF4328 domain-containing protein [Armatimonas sp.]
MKPAPVFTNITGLTKALRLLYIIGLAVCLELIVEDLRTLWLINHPAQYPFIESNTLWQRITGFVAPLLTLITVTVHLIWVYKSYRNAQVLNADVSATPAMAVLYYFIPILSLTKPCELMQEIWQISGRPKGWRNEKSSSLIFYWWGVSWPATLLAYWPLLSFPDRKRMTCRLITSTTPWI